MFNSGQPKPMIYRLWNLATHSRTTLRPNIDYHGTDAVLMLQSYPANQKNQSPKVHSSLYPAITHQMRQFRVASLSHDHDFTRSFMLFSDLYLQFMVPNGFIPFCNPTIQVTNEQLPTGAGWLNQRHHLMEQSTDLLLSTPGQLKRTVHLALLENVGSKWCPLYNKLMLQRPKHRKAEIRTQLNSVLQAPQKQCAPSLQKRRSGRPNLDVKRLHVF